MQVAIVFAALFAVASAGVLAPTLLAGPQLVHTVPAVRTVAVAQQIQPVVHTIPAVRTVAVAPVVRTVAVAPVVRTVAVAPAVRSVAVAQPLAIHSSPVLLG